MNTKKKIIIILTASLTIIGGSSYLIWNYYQTKDDQEKVENEASSEQQKENNSEIENPENNKTSPDGETEQQPADNSPEVENPEKKEENVEPQENDEQPLESYFSVFIVSWIIVFLAYLIILILQKNIKAEGPCSYLVFIKMVCEIVAYENCMVDKTKDLTNESDKYNSYLQLDLINLKKFLDAFLFQPQTGKDKVRQDAHRIIFNFRNRFSKGLLEFFLFFLFDYLFIIIVNLIIDIFFHGFAKTRSRLKINYLWTFIQRMNKLYKKIIAYLFLFCPLLIALITSILKVKDPSFVLEKQDGAIGEYWLLENFCNDRQKKIHLYLSQLFNELLFNSKFYKLAFKDGDNKDITHHNLDLTKVVCNQTTDVLEGHKKSFLEEGKILFQNMEKYFDKNSDFEKKILEKLQSFMNVANPF